MKIETLKTIRKALEMNIEVAKLQLKYINFPFTEAKTTVENNIKMNEEAISVINQEIEAMRMGVEL